jgi:hypothetical protein
MGGSSAITRPIDEGAELDLLTYLSRAVYVTGLKYAFESDNLDNPLPTKLVAKTDYYVSSIERNKTELARLHSLSYKAAKHEMTTSINMINAKITASNLADVERLARYKRMIAKVEGWEAPTAEHEIFKENVALMLLRQDIEHVSPRELVQKNQTGRQWVDEQIAKCERSISYDEAEIEKENTRIASAQKFIDLLVQSAKEEPVPVNA